METSECPTPISACPHCGSIPEQEGLRFFNTFHCGTGYYGDEPDEMRQSYQCKDREIATLRAELARLKSEKEAAERERDEARLENAINAADALRALEFDSVLGQAYPSVVEYSERRKKAIEASDALATIDAYNASWEAQLTAATSRAEAADKVIRRLMHDRSGVPVHFIRQYYKNGERIADFYHEELAALLPPEKEVEGGK